LSYFVGLVGTVIAVLISRPAFAPEFVQQIRDLVIVLGFSVFVVGMCSGCAVDCIRRRRWQDACWSIAVGAVYLYNCTLFRIAATR
jgi:hypothetical protein